MTKPMSKPDAVQRAYDCGHPEVALMILGDKVRTYTRTPKDKPGWQVKDYLNPYPAGTAAVVLVDKYDPDQPAAFYVVPIDTVRKLLVDNFNAWCPSGIRPRTPDSRHSVIHPDHVQQYRDAWAFYVPA